jgi:hypothetical protein
VRCQSGRSHVPHLCHSTTSTPYNDVRPGESPRASRFKPHNRAFGRLAAKPSVQQRSLRSALPITDRFVAVQFTARFLHLAAWRVPTPVLRGGRKLKKPFSVTILEKQSSPFPSITSQYSQTLLSQRIPAHMLLWVGIDNDHVTQSELPITTARVALECDGFVFANLLPAGGCYDVYG